MPILAIYSSTRGLQSTGKRSYIIFLQRPQNQKIFQNAKNHWNGKNPKTPRDMPILAIRPSTRGLQSTGNRSYISFSVFPRDRGAWSRGQIFFSGPWSTVLKANFLLGTVEHGPEGKYSPRDHGARSRGQIFFLGPGPKKKVWKWVKRT